MCSFDSFFSSHQVWTHMTGSDKNHLCTCVGCCQREYRANIAVGFDNCRVKWLIYNAASPSGLCRKHCSITRARERKREDETQKKANSRQRSASLKTPSARLWMVDFTVKFHSPRVIRARRDSIYNLGHARNATAFSYLPRLMLFLCFAAQTRLSVWKCFSNVRVELRDRQVQIKVIIKSKKA